MFITHKPEDIVILQGEYSLSIVLLSIVIAFLASYTALSLNERIRKNGFFSRNFWLVLASIAMGMGIWAMHFIGMSAFRLPVSMEYNLSATILSIFPAVMASYLAFYISNRTNLTRWPKILAGFIMGIGIASMHYIGMSAMEMEIDYAYQPVLFILSIMISILVSYVALYIFTSLQKFMGNFFLKAITSLLMGIAVASMHYTGMEAVVFYTEGNTLPSTAHAHHMNVKMLIVSVTLGIGVILGLSGLSSLLDRYVDFRLNHFDALTGMPNRRQFEKMLNVSSPANIAIIHLHGLEKWNRRYGYEVGDEVIRAVSETLVKLKPAYCMLYRIEGNRFALVLENERDSEKLILSMERIMAFLKKPLVINEKKLAIDMVCSVASSEGNDRSELFANAMAVLQHSHTAFNHAVIEYDPNIHTFAFERNLIQDIDRAMREDELFVLYQPKICSKTRVVFGVEALLRWKHSVHGVISPGIFIPILEENGKMHEVTDWLIDHVCKQISVWNSLELPIFKVAINIPGSYFTSPHLMETLKQCVSKYGIDSHFLELEITETSVIDQIEDAIRAVGAFKEFGFTVALDDFGTGVSSLSYLKRLPISTMKIDKSFVDDVPQSEKDSAIMKAIISLGHSLKLKVVIEGVENEEQMKFLSSNSENPIIQGYYYSKPLEADGLVSWIDDFNEIAV
ncbi:EAL domain-containing protein [Mesobacillus jeotgali]|uniref:EAL domain-containing protein n=1 Tax=Mesobacillus jeotgali TaxID=129985 RepID=A0ABY9VNH6_9BACI|nr:EAL domain-containing protein [Mesobacillus jeotgali]WNF24190.1 EAL domain-containing protein [Mesobacillus jeotgali]